MTETTMNNTLHCETELNEDALEAVSGGLLGMNPANQPLAGVVILNVVKYWARKFLG